MSARWTRSCAKAPTPGSRYARGSAHSSLASVTPRTRTATRSPVARAFPSVGGGARRDLSDLSDPAPGGRLPSLLPAPVSQDRKGVTPLMLACEGGHVEVVRRLLAAGAPWNELDNDNHCAGEWASASGHGELAHMLIEHAVQAELVLGVVARRDREPDLSYLATPVRYDGDDKLLDEDNDAVMMSWESPLMRLHARLICAAKGDVLNVGFGMGIIDGYIADENKTRSHTIIEAHPDVYAHMGRRGWMKKKNVRVEFGRWQDVLNAIADANDALPGGVSNENARLFDGVFFDTYGEEWDDMREFHALLPRVMRPGGVYSYFNGLAPDNIFFHTVYCRLAAKELGRLGFETSFDVVPIDTKSDEIWKGVKRRYWWGDTYFLPTCVLSGGTEGG